MKKLLIANRGEIAVRIIRAARELGIPTVAVYSEADRDAVHVTLADEAVSIGPSEASASYLSFEAILGAATETGADAIHPGYGFLSERAEFAEACEQAGIIFVGPPASAMRQLGAKTDAKALAVREGVPIVPGYFADDAGRDDLRKAAQDIGYPVMLKASAGGGGRGMRVVRDPNDFDSELSNASEEALKAFGDGTMMVEKLVDRPRHVEVQLLADQHGNIAPLFERECSVQRRHQKILEEAPSLVWDDRLQWDAMRDAAVRLARAAGYVGAGTVEFMVDDSNGEFYFLEVNARLQVEHPVTEAITGVDLVQWQLRIADGEALDLPAALLTGDRTAINGHSIEVRIVAEDPASGFMPSVGRIVGWAEPRLPGVRVDTGFAAGGAVSRFYDSLLAKVIVHALDRKAALAKLRVALLDTHVLGVHSNIAYLLDVIDHPDFKAGKVDTGFLGREFAEWTQPQLPPELGALVLHASEGASPASVESNQTASAWGTLDGFRNAEG